MLDPEKKNDGDEENFVKEIPYWAQVTNLSLAGAGYITLLVLGIVYLFSSQVPLTLLFVTFNMSIWRALRYLIVRIRYNFESSRVLLTCVFTWGLLFLFLLSVAFECEKQTKEGFEPPRYDSFTRYRSGDYVPLLSPVCKFVSVNMFPLLEVTLAVNFSVLDLIAMMAPQVVIQTWITHKRMLSTSD